VVNASPLIYISAQDRISEGRENLQIEREESSVLDGPKGDLTMWAACGDPIICHSGESGHIPISVLCYSCSYRSC